MFKKYLPYGIGGSLLPRVQVYWYLSALGVLFLLSVFFNALFLEPALYVAALLGLELVFGGSLYPKLRFFWVLGGLFALTVLGYFWAPVFVFAKLGLWLLIGLTLVDLTLLYWRRDCVMARREMADRLSNGDENEIQIFVQSRYSFPINVEMVDEIPHQFQVRDFYYPFKLSAGQAKTVTYLLRPVQRGVYPFGKINFFFSTPLGLFSRRVQAPLECETPVYPSYIQMRKYELMAVANRLSEIGVKRVRRIGHTMEFDQIRPYAIGDDYRNINWKATARKNDLMVNQYQDEKSQQIYSIIDMGRNMRMPFEGLTLLDYAINSALVLSNIALYRQDRAGLVTFSDKAGDVVKAHRKAGQLNQILEVLYKQETQFMEPNYEQLYVTLRSEVKQRSLLLLFTNFESVNAMRRNLPYLRRIARTHLLVVIFFQNTELKNLIAQPATDIAGVYTKTIAEKFDFEKNLIVRELQNYGVQAVLSTPEQLTVNAINKYLEIKARALI